MSSKVDSMGSALRPLENEALKPACDAKMWQPLSQGKAEQVYERIVAIYRNRGGEQYSFNELVTQEAHVLQCAFACYRAQAPEYMAVAALMHDIGHICWDIDEFAANRGVDLRHEALGCQFLQELGFPPKVFELVRLHVAAKRYMVTTDPHYEANLSEASRISLKVQGGAMSPEQKAIFEENPYHLDAVSLRYTDEIGKVAGLPVPRWNFYKPMVLRVLMGEPEALKPSPDFRAHLRQHYQQAMADVNKYSEEAEAVTVKLLSTLPKTKKPMQEPVESA